MSKPYNRKDHLYQKAKDEGYRSRAAYKLIELNQLHKLFRSGERVLDLGCWPGGWMQVASKAVGPSGIVVGVDLVTIEPLPQQNVRFIEGDARSEEMLQQLSSLVPDKFHSVISDMSPKLTGIREADMAGSVGCAEACLEIAKHLLLPNGSFVVKLFKSQESDDFVKAARPFFDKIKRAELDSTRSTSKEFYFVGLGWHLPK